MSNSAAPLIDYLRQLEARGEEYISVDDEARKILRAFYMRARSGVVASGPSSGSGKPMPDTAKRSGEVLTASNAKPQTEVLAPSLDQPLPSGSGAAEKIASLKQQVAKWAPLQELTGLRKTMVFSTGNPEADIMLVGEAPGYDEERLGEPFVGKAGQKLDGILKAMGVERKDTYISNIVKFRPAMPNQTTNNRKPTREEMDACMPFIREEVKVVEPKVIIALGGTAAEALLDCEDTVASMRGKFHDYAGIPLRVTYHPSYILHNEATSEKRKLWEDMLAVMDLLKMPVSEKQRGFFT
jgi:DNA polymerase